MSVMSAAVGSTVGFYGELWLGSVVGVGDVDIDEAREGKVGGAVSVRQTEIVFNMGCSG